MKIYIASSYISLPFLISDIYSNSNDYKIIAFNISIANFCLRLFEELKIIQIDYPNEMVIARNPFKIILNWIRIARKKSLAKKKLSKIKGNDVYFTDCFIYADFELWGIKFLSKKNHVYFSSYSNFNNTYSFEVDIKGKLYNIFNKFVYGTKLTTVKMIDKIYALIAGNEYLADIDANPFEIHINFALVNKIMEDKFNVKKRKILILSSSLIYEYQYSIKKEDYIEIIDEIIDFLIEKYGISDLAIKSHPHYLGYLSKENIIEKIEPELPASLIANNFDIVIGYSSTTLTDASHLGKKSISLVNMIKSDDKSIKFNTTFLKNNMSLDNPIIFPNNLIEFINLL